MPVGDPFKFAVIYETVHEWNTDDTFENGVMVICVNGFLIPHNEVMNITLKCAKAELKEKLLNIPQNNELYSIKSTEELFIKLYELRFPKDDNTNEAFEYQIAPTELTDKNHFIFAVTNGVTVRFLAAAPEYNPELSRHNLNKINIAESYTALEEIKKCARLL